MQVLIRMEDDDEDQELASLYQWLSQDPDVAMSGTVHLRPTAVRPGEMGGAFDAIMAIVGNATALASLIVAYLSWRDSRTRSPAVSIEHAEVVLNLSDISEKMIEDIVAELTEQVEP